MNIHGVQKGGCGIKFCKGELCTGGSSNWVQDYVNSPVSEPTQIPLSPEEREREERHVEDRRLYWKLKEQADRLEATRKADELAAARKVKQRKNGRTPLPPPTFTERLGRGVAYSIATYGGLHVGVIGLALAVPAVLPIIAAAGPIVLFGPMTAGFLFGATRGLKRKRKKVAKWRRALFKVFRTKRTRRRRK